MLIKTVLNQLENFKGSYSGIYSPPRLPLQLPRSFLPSPDRAMFPVFFLPERLTTLLISDIMYSVSRHNTLSDTNRVGGEHGTSGSLRAGRRQRSRRSVCGGGSGADDRQGPGADRGREHDDHQQISQGLAGGAAGQKNGPGRDPVGHLDIDQPRPRSGPLRRTGGDRGRPRSDAGRIRDDLRGGGKDGSGDRGTRGKKQRPGRRAGPERRADRGTRKSEKGTGRAIGKREGSDRDGPGRRAKRKGTNPDGAFRRPPEVGEARGRYQGSPRGEEGPR